MEGNHGNEDSNEEEEKEVTRTTTRIFVGGLGENVRRDDLGKIFSSLGQVKGVDIVRTKGRSFAYLDFLPSSPKSLPKLFSTYNGCAWKGGRLRLEKAKQHYLVRLRQEWAQDAELASSAPSNDIDADKNMASSEKPRKALNPEKTQLRIFFPRLRKVKSLPFSGTGKHKYSFQRVEVPSVPVHFCDCEEHSVPSHTAKESHFYDLEAQSGGINEEELNMMNLVMNKLFERENDSKAASSGAELNEGDNSIKSIDDLVLDGNELNGEDNLILNMVTRGNSRMALLWSREPKKISANQESRFGEFQTYKDDPTLSMLDIQKRKIVPSNKKRKLLLSEESNRNEFVPAIPKRRRSLQTNSNESETLLEALPTRPESGVQQSVTSLSWSQKSAWRELVGDRGNSPFSISHVLPVNGSMKKEQRRSGGLNVPEATDSKNQDLVKHGNFEGQLNQFKELEGLTEAQPTKSTPVDKSTRGSSWLQKSSWMQLVGETNSNSFSLSQILPGITFEKRELPKSNSMGVANSTDSNYWDLVKRDKSESTANGSKLSRLGTEGLLTAPSSSSMVALDKEQNFNGLDVEQSTPERNMQAVGGNDELSVPVLGKKDHSAPKQISISESCSFMRSTASVREWVNAKAALSGSLKKKR